MGDIIIDEKYERLEKDAMLKKYIGSLEKRCLDTHEARRCLDIIDVRLNYIKDNNTSTETLLKYFKTYEKLSQSPIAEYYILYSQYYKNNKNIKESIENIKKALSLEPNNIDYLKKFISLYRINKDWKSAAELSEKIVSILNKKISLSDNSSQKNKLKSSLIKELARLFELTAYSDPKKLINELYPSYETFIQSMQTKSFPYYLSVKFSRGTAYSKLNKYHKAVKIFKEIIDIYNKNPNKNKVKPSWIAGKHLSLSWYQLVINDYKSAIKTANAGITLDKYLPKINFNTIFPSIGR